MRKWIFASAWAAVLIPALFFAKFGEVGPLGWGLTVFVMALCLLTATGLHFLRRPQYHTPVQERGDWADRLGAFWLLACAFGPLAGYLVAELTPLTLTNWRWVYGGRVVLGGVLPVLTALPLTRYVRGRGAPVMIAILLGVTALPLWSCWATLRDLRDAPLAAGDKSGRQWYLPHTSRMVH